MAIVERVGYGTILSNATGTTTESSTAFTAVAACRSISGRGGTGGKVNVHTMDSTHYAKQLPTGMVEPDDIELEMIFGSSDASQKNLNALLKSQKVVGWAMQPAGSTVANVREVWTGWVMGVGEALPKDDAITRTVTLGVTQDPGFRTT